MDQLVFMNHLVSVRCNFTACTRYYWNVQLLEWVDLVNTRCSGSKTHWAASTIDEPED